MRIAVRRLRAILPAFAPLLPNEARRRVSRESRWLTQRSVKRATELFGGLRSMYADSLERGVRRRLDRCCVHRNQPQRSHPPITTMVMINTTTMTMAITVKGSIWLKRFLLGRSHWDTAGLSVPGAG
jgi:hypothetical protein